MIPEVLSLMKLIIVSPATNAIIEKSFSALKSLKTACWSTMSDPRLNNLVILHIKRDILPSTVDIVNEFFDRSEYRNLEMQFRSRKIYVFLIISMFVCHVKNILK